VRSVSCALDHGNDQAFLAQGGANPDVHVVIDFDAIFEPAAVHRRRCLHRSPASGDEIRCKSQIGAVACECLLVRTAMRTDGAEIGFEHSSDVRRSLYRALHVLGDSLAHGIVWNASHPRRRCFRASLHFGKNVLARQPRAAHRHIIGGKAMLFQQPANSGRELSILLSL
jgi:hypothetical protein